METIQSNGLWHITLVEKDLVNQAGLNPDAFKQDLGFFRYMGRPVAISHIFNNHLVVSMEGEDDGDLAKLVNGFSKVIEYKPFCKYVLNLEEGSSAPPLPTYEWDKINPKNRFEELKQKENVSSLEHLYKNRLIGFTLSLFHSPN